MRLRFRVLLYEHGRRLRKRDISGRNDPLWRGIRYITEFKYLEATKWLLIAPDCWEKYILLALINLSFGQREQAKEFVENLREQTRRTELSVVVEAEGVSREVREIQDIAELFSQ